MSIRSLQAAIKTTFTNTREIKIHTWNRMKIYILHPRVPTANARPCELLTVCEEDIKRVKSEGTPKSKMHPVGCIFIKS